MKLFDAHVYSDARPDGDFANMAWFDVERVLLCAHAPRPFQTARDLWEYLDQLLHAEAERVERLGLEARVAVGIAPEAVPRRAHYEIWRELPHLLTNPRVAALGELGVEDAADEPGWRLVERQLRLLTEAGLRLPALFRLPRTQDTRARRAVITRLAALVDQLGVSRGAIVALHTDWLTIDAVEAAGFHAGLTVGGPFLPLPDAVRIILHHDRRNLILGTGLRAGPADVLALPKLAVALADAGVPAADIERVLFGNAMSLFVRSP